MEALLTKLKRDFPQLNFALGEVFSWSSRSQTVHYTDVEDDTRAIWSLLHEVGHGLLGHTRYQTDFELVKLEAAAWDKAAEVGRQYGHLIDTDHIQDCLDTYRDWLHQRSACPTCGIISLQKDQRTYSCYNCHTEWQVSRSRLCRPYRLLQKETAGL